MRNLDKEHGVIMDALDYLLGTQLDDIREKRLRREIKKLLKDSKKYSEAKE